jgi:hypothetical protein
MVACGKSCATWLARSLGLDGFSNPAAAVNGLLLGGGLNSKQAEVARMINWIDRALPLERLVEEHQEGEGLPMYIQPGKDANWFEVETAPPGSEDIEIHREVAGFESRLNDALRAFAKDVDSIEDLFLHFCEAGMRLEESIAQRVRRGRVVRVVPRPHSTPPTDEEWRAAEQAVQNWTNRNSRWDALTLKYAAVHTELDVFRQLVQLRRPFEIEETHPLSKLMMPSTPNEWNAARRVFQKILMDLGCEDPEVGEILGGGRRAAAELRRRMGELDAKQ